MHASGQFSQLFFYCHIDAQSALFSFKPHNGNREQQDEQGQVDRPSSVESEHKQSCRLSPTCTVVHGLALNQGVVLTYVSTGSSNP